MNPNRTFLPTFPTNILHKYISSSQACKTAHEIVYLTPHKTEAQLSKQRVCDCHHWIVRSKGPVPQAH